MEYHINAPFAQEDLNKLRAGDMVYISGTIYVARDAAHKRMYEALQRGEVTQKWESGGEAKMALSYIYDHLDAFRLLICKSAGTRYETFLHDLAVEEEKTTIAMMNMLKAQGKQINNIRPEEFHLLVTTNVNAVFQAVEHGFTREEAMHYADTLDAFFPKAWQAFFGY